MNWITQDMGALAVTVEALNCPEAENVPDLPLYKHELKYAKPWPSHPGIINIARNIITPYAQKAIVGEMSVQRAMDKAAEEAQKSIEGD